MQITMDDEDFLRLQRDHEAWAANAAKWADEIERFEVPEGGHPSLRWKHAWWMGSYAAVILARSYLAELGHEFEVAYHWNDPDEEKNGWVILTDYGRSPA